MKKISDFFSTKVKLKIMIFSIVFGIYFLFSFLMATPGVGIESLRFINSVHNQISQVMPQGVYVIDGKDPAYNTVMENVIKKAYSADAISTLNSYTTKNYEKKRSDYAEFAAKWYENRWGESAKNNQDIDLYDLGVNLIEFDKAVSTEFLSYGYVNPGIGWIFRDGGLKEIFSSHIKEELLRNQTFIDQDLYDSKMETSPVGMEGIDIYSSIGSLLVNNKVWYLNKQIQNIKYGMNIFGHSIFKDKTLNESKMPKTKVEINELYVPHFTEVLDNLRAGSILFFVALATVPFYAFALTVLLINKKRGNS
ncbi:hypothetical protein SHELI_v1c00440 [Spiroplasma helicoides]|uniref:Uncharacterized protein n=1 Tax=Spiroplasma helicoides TaxID=216938 RepID=A0A1B3SJ96_9MOLU|nr:hypothetical protein [Spiroplasma helicoides]AOG59999.1 hypothetical protein SHELI_v1c00440 [Spiroplasma helicoides]